MTPTEIDTVLNTAEVEIAFGGTPDLKKTGFWRAVAAVKREPALIDQFADRIGAIDKAGFAAWAWLVVPIWIGTMLAVVGTLVGLSLISSSALITSWSGFVFLAGTGVLIMTTHGLGHLVAGFVGGIRFSAWFIGGGRPQPGVKTDYATYLRATPRSRAWMHASGALVTKAIPFLLLPPALLITTIPTWVSVVLIVLGVAQIITDAAWSTKSSDWAKFKREMRYAGND
ncbi:MAG: hypothetical protein BMS9Abin12_0187 [Acidimicrobiia bacterium]|nr:MAG: hypothetical protein BMS9Abin12_0187 [Acidimicrobiia bacterium]